LRFVFSAYRLGDPETGGRNAGFCGPKLPVVRQRLRDQGLELQRLRRGPPGATAQGQSPGAFFSGAGAFGAGAGAFSGAAAGFSAGFAGA